MTVTAVLTHPLFLMFVGMFGNFFKNLSDLENQGKSISPWAFLKKYPYRMIIQFIGIFAGYAVLNEMQELTSAIACLGVGYLSHDILDSIANRTNQMIANYKISNSS